MSEQKEILRQNIIDKAVRYLASKKEGQLGEVMKFQLRKNEEVGIQEARRMAVTSASKIIHTVKMALVKK
jgi:hypothetical protein